MPSDCDCHRPDADPEITLSEAEITDRLAAMANEQCRHLIDYLLANDATSVTADALVDHIAEITDESPETVRTALHHRNWPQLEDAGLVKFDPATGTLSYTGGRFTKDILETAAISSDQSYHISGEMRE